MTRLMIVMMMVTALTGCAALKTAYADAQHLNDEYGPGFWSLVQGACARSYARSRSIELEQAKEKFCATEEQVKPWIDVLLQAERRGATRAGIKKGE